ncbi:pyridoxal-dependent decarboxylase conserved domain protein [Diaporthe eres]|nr:pyridoxal-dependent decarboxylase conserved domain protein [Diaporthe eres]
MGVYGVEGSKPGASAVATWLTHKTRGLTERGYGRLLGEAVVTCKKLYCYWATLTAPDSELIVVPLMRLPAEKEGGGAEDDRGAEVLHLGVSNEELIKDQDAVKLLKKLGADRMINAFACNFRIGGKPNNNVVEANYLNERIFKQLSVTSMADVVTERPLSLTQSSFGEKEYGSELTESFRTIAEEEVKACFGDGYLRTDDIVEEMNALRPYSRLRRTRASMEFAGRVWASTDADVLEYRRPARGEADLYRDRAVDELAVQRIMRDIMPHELAAANDLAEEVLQVFILTAANVQSRLG